jgi:high affinity Mn2+ porin
MNAERIMQDQFGGPRSYLAGCMLRVMLSLSLFIVGFGVPAFANAQNPDSTADESIHPQNGDTVDHNANPLKADGVNSNNANSSNKGTDSSSAAATPSDQAPEPPEEQRQNWNFHMQITTTLQGYPSFYARYAGPNSLPTSSEVRETVSLDLYSGFRLWTGAEMHVDLLTWQGFGLGNTLGIDDFPDGEAYKVGTHPPREGVARLFIRQTIGLGGEKENLVGDQLTLAGKQDISRLTITIGRFSSKDIFDNNAYANDPRTQFMNWAFTANAAWDYPADGLGYTTGVAVEWNHPKWTLRYGFFQITSLRNGFTAEDRYFLWPGEPSGGDGRFWHAWDMVVEDEHRYSINTHRGIVRILGYVNQGEFGSYSAALYAPDTNIDLTHALRHDFGFGLNLEQEITKNIGVFSRLGWNDGINEAWMFTDVNHMGSVGVSIKGEAWNRPGDTIGVAGVISGISADNRRYLAAGGLGILDGDGALNYAKEKVVETYYQAKIAKHLLAALDYQFVADPAFNSARGPVSVFGARFHFDF